jgi:AbiV family abortive infection protein
MPKQIAISLTFEQLSDAYTKSIDNAMRLHSAGVCLLKKHPEICLGLFELGQEELGKSYSCLAAMGVKEDAKEFWKSFWEEWKNHEIKAHRAFYYELLNPTRLEAISANGKRLSGLPIRGRIHKEKESSFYVNYDNVEKKFVGPWEGVSREEVINRGVALTGLISTALDVSEAFEEGDKKRNYRTFGIIPFQTLMQIVYQQDMPGIYQKFASISPFHKSIIAKLEKVFEKGKGTLRDLVLNPEKLLRMRADHK